MRAPQTFSLTILHLILLKAMNVSWNNMESGAPTIDPKRPYGNGDVLEDMRRLLGESALYRTDEELWKLHAEMETALQVVLVTEALGPGDFVAPAYTHEWRRR